jgi:hypothetical protein
MEEVVQITDHARRGILNLNPVFWGKPRIMSFVWAMTSEVQVLEDAIYSVILLRMVDNAFPLQLAILGSIVGQPNSGGFDTEVYRSLIKAKIRTNRSHGTLRDILETFRLLHPPSAKWYQAGWATLALIAEDAADLVLEAATIVLRNAKQAEEGVLLYVAQSPTGLRADSYTDTEAATGGWGSASDPSVGGLAFHVRRVSSLGA